MSDYSIEVYHINVIEAGDATVILVKKGSTVERSVLIDAGFGGKVGT